MPMPRPHGMDEHYQYLTCRDLRHSWRKGPTQGSTEGEASRTLTCSRCGTTRTETFAISHRWGSIRKTGHKYRYPEGYLMKSPGVSAGRTAQQARLISILSELRGP